MKDEIQRIAVMGGTFDPIHYGHLLAAEAVRHVYGLEKVLFIPTGRPPHKENLTVSGSERRYLMTLMATASNPHFQVSRIEIDRPGLTYTIDTISELHEQYKNVKLYFITGADAVHQILTWKDADKLLSECGFVAVTRPGYNKDSLSGQIRELRERFPEPRLHLLEIPGLMISSSDIRSRAYRGEPIKYLLPEEVERYIAHRDLYGQGKEALTTHMEDIVAFLKRRLGKKRYTHTMGTAATAVRLSIKYGADPEKAYIAALLHDCAKDYSPEKTKKLCKSYGIRPDKTMKEQPDLMHGYLGAEIAKKDFSVTDEDMLNAIRYHTTGRKAMSLMEKIIYLSDGIEPGRKQYPGLDDIRKKSEENLDQAVCICLEHTIGYVRESCRLLHPLSVEALKYYKKSSGHGSEL